jgi:hypothetical protein
VDIKVYLHRTKKQNYAVCECISITLDFDKIPEDKRDDIDFLNRGFSNDAQRLARETKSVKKYGTGYLSFIRPQYEGPEEENGTDKVYFNNETMLFELRETPEVKSEK